MINWDRIVESNIIQTVRKVCYKWWGIDIRIYDEYVNLKTPCLPNQNDICNLLNTTTNGSQACLQSCRKNLKEIGKYQKPLSFECHAGLYVVAVPLVMKNCHAGSLVGCGATLSTGEDKVKKINAKKLADIGLDESLIKQYSQRLKSVDNHSKEYMIDFITLVAEEVMEFYEMLLEKDEIINRQSVLLERAYNDKYKCIIGKNREMKKIFDILEMVENNEIPVLLEGESGTGKELIAEALHYNSPRRNKMFLVLNCSTFNDTLLSSELFGHEKGSFTGAMSEKKGLFEIANGGTLFLDEIGDMKIEAQAQVLRVLENGTFYRVGGTEQIKVDVRIIVATNKKLKEQIKQGLFRDDLFYRINNIHIKIPPLRDRKDDILNLIHYFLESYAETHKTNKKEISNDVIKQLVEYDWPGNVRELKNLIENLIIFSGKNKIIDLKSVHMEIMGSFSSQIISDNRKVNDAKLRDTLRNIEKDIVKDELQAAKWNKTMASKKLGISRAALNNKIEQYKLLQE